MITVLCYPQSHNDKTYDKSFVLPIHDDKNSVLPIHDISSENW